MILSILFLVSCVITARFLEKRKMRVAAALYSVLFIVILGVLIFALDFPLTRVALTNVFGAPGYRALHEGMLGVMQMNFYGISVAGVIALSFAIQLAIIIFGTTKKIVHAIIRRADKYKFKKVYYRSVYTVHPLYISKRINLLYCRMLN